MPLLSVFDDDEAGVGLSFADGRGFAIGYRQNSVVIWTKIISVVLTVDGVDGERESLFTLTTSEQCQ